MVISIKLSLLYKSLPHLLQYFDKIYNTTTKGMSNSIIYANKESEYTILHFFAVKRHKLNAF